MGKKLFSCKMKTDTQSVEEIMQAEPMFNKEQAEHCKKFYEKLHGLELSLYKWDDKEQYVLCGYSDKIEEQVKEAMFYQEMCNPFSMGYTLEEFEKAWKEKEYDPGCAIVFEPDQVEVVKLLKEWSDLEIEREHCLLIKRGIEKGIGEAKCKDNYCIGYIDKDKMAHKDCLVCCVFELNVKNKADEKANSI